MSPISTKVSTGITGPQPAAVTHGILNLISTGTTLHLISQSCNLFRGNQIHFQLKIFKSFFMTFLTMPVADLGGARDICPPVEILSISCSFWKHLAKSYVAPPPGLAPRLGEILDPSLHAQVNVKFFKNHILKNTFKPFSKFREMGL